MNAKRKDKNFSGNHQRSWLWGFHAVSETMIAGKWPILEIYVNQAGYENSEELLRSKQLSGVSVEVVSSLRLQQLTGSSEHQGLVARMGLYPYTSQELLERRIQDSLNSQSDSRRLIDGQNVRPMVVICDRIQDAFNFGSILRCCDGAQALGVIVGAANQAEVTPHVARSSSGAVNYVSVTKSENLIASAARMKQLGLQLVAADSNATCSVWQSSLRPPTALIIGSEALGVSPALLEMCNQTVSIPMHGHVTSLNAAVAAGIILYEIRRQQSMPEVG